MRNALACIGRHSIIQIQKHGIMTAIGTQTLTLLMISATTFGSRRQNMQRGLSAGTYPMKTAKINGLRLQTERGEKLAMTRYPRMRAAGSTGMQMKEKIIGGPARTTRCGRKEMDRQTCDQ